MDIQHIDTERILGEPNTILDDEYWLTYLDSLDMDESQKVECVATVWNAMWAFASLAFQANPIQQVGIDCGQNPEIDKDQTSDSKDVIQ